MNRRVAVTLLLALCALPAAAGEVTVGTTTATQYDYPYFVAVVHASGTSRLTDIHLVVNGATVIQPDRVEPFALDRAGNYVSWTVFKYATNVVRPGDTLTAVVRDVDADSGEKSVGCTTGSTRRKSRETAVCR